MRAIDAFLEILSAGGVRHVFGNPGTTELPLNDALIEDDRFRYILGLQEVPVVAAAEGYALASQSLGVVNLHICCGLGNAMGMIYNAHRAGAPLLITAGQQDRRLMMEEPILAGDMVSVAKPWTKWAHEVQRAEDLPTAVRRAAQVALMPPTGPVFLSLPVDVQLELLEGADTSPPAPPNSRVRPPREALKQAAELLAAAKSPAVLAGSRVTERGAVDELVAVAERLGAAVMSESGTTHGRLAFPSDHPLNAQGLPLWSPEVLERLRPHDVVLVAGMDLFRQYIYHEPACPIPEGTRLIHLDEDPWQLGKNYPLAVGLWGDTQSGLAELAERLAQTMTAEQKEAAVERTAKLTAAHAAAREKLRVSIAEQRPARPMTSNVFMHALSEVLPPDVAVVEEAVTTTNTMFERLGALQNTTGYFGHRGWALGWGLGVSLGVQLAWPRRPVLAILGEGASMYGIQGLWTAARYALPVTFVIANNAQYRILKICAGQLDLPTAARGEYLGMDLNQPEIDFVALSQSLGVEGCRIAEPEELAERVAANFKDRRPLLIDVPIQRESGGKLNYG